MMKPLWLSLLILSLFLGPRGLLADESGPPSVSAEHLKFFETKIRPILVRECYGCHSSQVGQVRGGLWLDSSESMRSGGDSGPAIVPGNIEESLLWNALNHIDFAMPPRKKLSDEVLTDFRTWIEMGAPDPRTQQESHIKSAITDEDIKVGRNFWSFRPPRRPEVPGKTSPPRNEEEHDSPGTWASNDIDRFIHRKLISQGLQPAPDAEPRVVLRRLSFDLIGLPPTPEQLSQFEENWLRDPATAVARITDWFLDQPQFGERWGRHWLDVARYAESAGREVNMTFPHAWRYRDYVIESFNKDKPYDRFVQEQIAGDLLPVDNDDQWKENLIATGFLAIGPKALIERNPRQFELDLIDEQIDVTTRVMLGVSVACARCHDHKFDPIPQTDYYALAGVFRSMTTHYGTFRTLQNRRPSNLIELPVDDDIPLASPLSREELEKLRDELDRRKDDLQQALRARRMRQNPQNNNISNGPNRPAPSALIQPAVLSSAVGILESIIDSYSDDGKPLALCMGVQETRPVTARLLERGEFNRPAQEVPRGFPQVLCDQPVSIEEDSTGRLELARWIGSKDNSLTARVMANRIWLHLMGTGIVRTPEDFGSTGSPPTHPELLDYLAVEFMENDWSVKQLIRKIVGSRTYRMSSRFDPKSFEIDPENLYYWRIDSKRLEAEAIRDAILAISGRLNLDAPPASLVARAGPAAVRDGRLISSVPRELNAPSSMNRLRQTTTGEGMAMSTLRPSFQSLDEPDNYRSVYLPILRENIPRSLDVFDFAEASMVIGQRETSNTPDQGLFFLNSSFVMEQADAMATRIMQYSHDPREQIDYAFRLTYGRPPERSELRVILDFLKSYRPGDGQAERLRAGQKQRFAQRQRSVRTSENSAEVIAAKLSAVCQSLMAAAEFRYLD